jgi:transcriptional regulator with XRE-family HTH domain
VQLADRVGVSQEAVKAWETGARSPRAGTQVRLAQVLGVGFEDLEVGGPADAQDLRRLRESLGWTRAEAAERLGIDASALKRVEAGAELPPDPKVMCRVYGVTAGELAAVVRGTR